MNKILIYGAIAAVVLAGAVYFATIRGVSAPAASEDRASGSLKALMAKGDVKCEVETIDTAVRSSGTVYVAGGKMRGDMTAVTPQATFDTHVIADGAYVYTWLEGSAQGVKLSMQLASGSTSSPVTTIYNDGNGTTTDSGSPDIYNSNVNYTCEPWTPDTSIFAPPSSVEFNDLSAMTQGSASAGGYSLPNCSVCDMVQGEQREQCRVAMKCQ